jgi:hypothetical protein
MLVIGLRFTGAFQVDQPAEPALAAAA